MTMTCIIGESPVSVHVLPIDVAGSLSKASPGQACGQRLTPGLPRNTRNGVDGDGTGVVLGSLCGVRAPPGCEGKCPDTWKRGEHQRDRKTCSRDLFKL